MRAIIRRVIAHFLLYKTAIFLEWYNYVLCVIQWREQKKAVFTARVLIGLWCNCTRAIFGNGKHRISGRHLGRYGSEISSIRLLHLLLIKQN